MSRPTETPTPELSLTVDKLQTILSNHDDLVREAIKRFEEKALRQAYRGRAYVKFKVDPNIRKRVADILKEGGYLVTFEDIRATFPSDREIITATWYSQYPSRFSVEKNLIVPKTEILERLDE